jgi:leader peptidase (prepilin peptidase)/N-methyltransferase
MIIPDAVTRPATIAGILGNTIFGCVSLVPAWYAAPGGLTFSNVWWIAAGQPAPPGWMPVSIWNALVATAPPAWVYAHPHLHGLAVSLSGIAVGAFIVWLVRTIGFWALGREAMGDGDIYLLAMIGSFLGWQATIVIFFLAPISALLMSVVLLPFRRSREIPYGPYLSVTALLVLFAFPVVWPPFESGIFSLGPLVPVLVLVMAPALAGLLRLSRFILYRLGFETEPPQEMGVWESADQLSYLAMERVDEQQNTWRTPQWPGVPVARGQAGHLRWRRMENGAEWRRKWARSR